VGGVDGDGAGEEGGVGDDDPAAVVGADEGGAGLDLLDGALVGAVDDLVVDAEGLGGEQEEAGEVVLEDVAEGEADGDGGEARELDELAGGEGREDDDRGEVARGGWGEEGCMGWAGCGEARRQRGARAEGASPRAQRPPWAPASQPGFCLARHGVPGYPMPKAPPGTGGVPKGAGATSRAGGGGSR
jgi:hypothetical protein